MLANSSTPCWTSSGKVKITSGLLCCAPSFFFLNCLFSCTTWKPFGLAPQLFFSWKEILVSFSCWHHFSFSLFILTRTFWPRSFKSACQFPLLELQGSFQWTRSGFVSGGPQDSSHLAWPRASHFAFCYWINLLLSNFLAKRSLCNVTHRSNLIAREMLSGAQTFLYSLCWHTYGLEAMESFTLTICLSGHIASSPSPEPKREAREPRCAGLWASRSSPSVFNRASRQTGAYLKEHWSRGSTCASSLHGRERCWTQSGSHWESKLWSSASFSLRLTRRGKRGILSKVSLKRGFLRTSDQETSHLGMSRLSFSSLTSTSFFKWKLKKKSFLCNPLLLKLITKPQVLWRLLPTCHTAVNLKRGAGFLCKLENNRSLCCTNGRQLQITSRSHLPCEWGCVRIWRAEHNPSSLPASCYQEICSFCNNEEVEYISCCTAHVLIKTTLPVTVFSGEVKWHLESMLNEFPWIPSPIIQGKRHLNEIWGFPDRLEEAQLWKKENHC